MRRRHVLLAALAVALPLLASNPSVAQQSSPAAAAAAPSSEAIVAEQAGSWIADGLYLVSYSGELWRVDSASDQAYPITYEEWAESGFEAYQPAPTDYVRYAWSGTLYAVTFFGPDREQWLWEHMTFEQWSRAGQPGARAAGWIEGTDFYQWASSPNLYVVDAGNVVHSLTWGEYQAAGQPRYDRYDGGYFQLGWDKDRYIVFIAITGNASPEGLPPWAFGVGRAITGAEWDALGRPTPQTVDRHPRHTGQSGVVVETGSRVPPGSLMYESRAYRKRITNAEWVAMGSPQPQVGCTGQSPCVRPDTTPYQVGLPPFYAWGPSAYPGY